MSESTKPILLRAWSDYHTLGIFCQKTNLVRYALKNCSFLKTDADKRRLFDKGIADAHEHSIADIAFTISKIRAINPARFDKKIFDCAGLGVVRQIQKAVEPVPRDWQTPQQVKAGQEITQEMTNPRKDYWLKWRQEQDRAELEREMRPEERVG